MAQRNAHSMKKHLFFLFLTIVLAVACSPQITRASSGSSIPADTESTTSSASPSPVLLFDIGMHIEPFGAVTSSLVRPTNQPKQGGKANPSYNNAEFFQRQVQDINTVASIIEKHGGRMTIQTQSPFTTQAARLNSTVLSDLADRGHEIGFHFHEDAHLGKNSSALSAEKWCGVMKEEIGLIRKAGVEQPIRYWSGGNLYPGVLYAGACAGLDVNSDWKNPNTQKTDTQLIGIHPWRPAGGPSENDLSAFARNDPDGKVIFLPEGLHAREDFASMRRAQGKGGNEAYFEFLKQSFEQSLAAAQADQVNVFHFTVHPGEFRGSPSQPFAVIDRFLTEVVDPAVHAGKVQWATFSEMADAYRLWETTH